MKKRLPFGITSSPFILADTITGHLKKYQILNPESVNMLSSSLSVDDFNNRSGTVDNAYQLSSAILKHASMNLCKFKSRI